jgi:hypothetical protein
MISEKKRKPILLFWAEPEGPPHPAQAAAATAPYKGAEPEARAPSCDTLKFHH